LDVIAQGVIVTFRQECVCTLKHCQNTLGNIVNANDDITGQVFDKGQFLPILYYANTNSGK